MATPRINGGLLGSYIGRKVRFVGQVDNVVEPSKVVFKDGSGAQVVINAEATSPPMDAGGIYEILGEVQPDSTVSEHARFPYNAEFNLQQYNEVVQLAQTMKHLFE